MIWVLFSVCLITVWANVFLILLWRFNFKTYPIRNIDLPKVSILIAARNEENNIKCCLESAVNLDYPSDKLEILVGDDASEDDTLKMAYSFDSYSSIKIVPITQSHNGMTGKANVLAQLAKVASGEYYFMTDADISLPKKWINQLLGAMTNNVGMTIGVTGVTKNGFQNIEWIFSIAMVKVITDIGKPVTGIGNNMVVSREAYESVGGFEGIPFSVTEDYEIFKQIRKNGFKCLSIFQSDALAISQPITGFVNLMQQRKRWMNGAMRLPWLMVLLLFIQGAFSVAIIPLMILQFKLGLAVLLIKLLAQSIFILLAADKSKAEISLTHLTLFEFYTMVVGIGSLITYVLPGKIKWKGRSY